MDANAVGPVILLFALLQSSSCFAAEGVQTIERRSTTLSKYTDCIAAADGRGAGPFQDCMLEATKIANIELRKALSDAEETQSPAVVKRIERSQTSWLAYRDEACNAELESQGVGHPAGIETQGVCLLQITRERIARLSFFFAQ